MRRARGSSLLELVIASTVVILVLLSLIGAIAFGLEGVRTAEGHQMAVFHARRLMALIRERGYPKENIVSVTFPGFQDAPASRDDLHAPPFDSDFPADTGYTRNLYTEPLSLNPADYESKVYRVKVSVYWVAKRRSSEFRISGLYNALY